MALPFPTAGRTVEDFRRLVVSEGGRITAAAARPLQEFAADLPLRGGHTEFLKATFQNAVEWKCSMLGFGYWLASRRGPERQFPL
ncbi:MAG: hypothetical protein C5B50_04305 [Verrucomicrobia bacterium]|nr:MAG: hypothetical protein C5B50_04305 [Verrucomicrobiota bacterium]